MTLEKTDTGFEKTVDLPSSGDKILYKVSGQTGSRYTRGRELRADDILLQFIVDGEWTTDSESKVEKDHEGNANNVLYAEDIESSDSQSSAIMSGVAPNSR